MKAETATVAMLPPRERREFFWHQQTEQSLLEQWRRGKLHHTLLLTGQRGIGKATFAYRFARHLLVPKAPAGPSLFGNELPEGDIDFEHSASRRITTGSHADLLVIETAFDEKKGQKQKEITIDDARKIQEFLALTPAESDWRVVIIDSVDELNRNAANAVLKILEEPPARAFILLVSHNPGLLLPTIRSRCHSVKFTPPDADTFGHILRLSAPDTDVWELQNIYRFSNHSPGVALERMESQALRLLQEMYVVLCTTPVPIAEKVRYVNDLVSTDNTANWQAVTHASRWLLMQVAAYKSGIRGDSETVEGEHEAIARIAERKDLAAWFELNDWITGVFSDTERLNLDRKQAVLAFLNACA